MYVSSVVVVAVQHPLPHPDLILSRDGDGTLGLCAETLCSYSSSHSAWRKGWYSKRNLESGLSGSNFPCCRPHRNPGFTSRRVSSCPSCCDALLVPETRTRTGNGCNQQQHDWRSNVNLAGRVITTGSASITIWSFIGRKTDLKVTFTMKSKLFSSPWQTKDVFLLFRRQESVPCFWWRMTQVCLNV